MSFKAGAIYGEAILDTKKWESGLKTLAKGTGTVVKAVGAAFVAAMTVSIAKANEFQKEMSNVSTVIDTSVISTQDMTKELLKLDPSLGKTTDLTAGLYNAFSAGAETMDEALQTTVDAAKFSKAALTSNATAVDVLTTAQNAYGKEVMSTTTASDIFFTTIKQGKITGEQLAGSIGQSIPLFASMDIELEQLASGMAAMTKQGISANESTTQLNGIVNAFLKPSEEMEAALKGIGFESGSAFIEAEGLTGALEFLENQTGGNKDELAKLIPNINGMKGAMALTGTGGKEFNKIMKEMDNSLGATDEAFSKQELTMETLSNQMDTISIVVGNVGKSFTDQIAVGATEAAGGILDFITSAEGANAVANTIGFLGGTFDLLKTILTPMINTLLPELKTIFSTFGETITEIKGDTDDSTVAFDVLGIATATLSAGFKIVSNVIQVTIESAGNLVTAILASGETVSTFFKFLTRDASWEEVKEKATIAKDGFVDFGKGVVSSYLDVGQAVQDAVSGFTADAVVSSREIKTSFTTSFTEIKQNTLDTYDELITGQEDMVEEIIESNDGLVIATKEGNEEISEVTTTIMGRMFNVIKDKLSDYAFSWEGLYDSIMTTVDTALGSIESISSLFFSNQEDELEINTQIELDAIDEKYASRIEKLTALTEEEIEIDKNHRQSELDDLTVLTEEELALEAFKRDQKITELSESLEEEDKLELAAMLAKEKREQDLLAAEIEIEAERKVLSDTALTEEQKRITDLAVAEKEKADEIAAINQKALEDQNDIAESQFKLQKGLQIASVWMDAASAIGGFWASAPLLGPIAGPIFGGVMSAAMLGMAGVQTSLINKQQFIPAREKGGMASGVTRINEVGGEIVTLPDGSQVIPNDISREIAQSTGSSRDGININFNDTIISSDIDIEQMAYDISHILGKELAIS